LALADWRIAFGGFAEGGLRPRRVPRGRGVAVFNALCAGPRGVARREVGEIVVLLRCILDRSIATRARRRERGLEGELYLISGAICPSSGGKIWKRSRDLRGIRGE
jgi:hypothetical protein